MVCDWDDLAEDDAGKRFLIRLAELRDRRADFRCTVFAIPGRGSDQFWQTIPDWIELAVHGWMHPDVYECRWWTEARMWNANLTRPVGFVPGFKAPGWQISDGCYTVLQHAGWWVADHPETRDRRPEGLLVHELNVGPEHWHGHVTNCCGNGIEETWDHVVALVDEASGFEFMSECVTPWSAKVAA